MLWQLWKSKRVVIALDWTPVETLQISLNVGHNNGYWIQSLLQKHIVVISVIIDITET